MQSWATSKQQPGQFTGSTGAQILTQAQLASGYQAWAKKVFSLKPQVFCIGSRLPTSRTTPNIYPARLRQIFRFGFFLECGNLETVQTGTDHFLSEGWNLWLCFSQTRRNFLLNVQNVDIKTHQCFEYFTALYCPRCDKNFFDVIYN